MENTIARVYKNAGEAFAKTRQLSLKERTALLKKLKTVMAEETDNIIDIVCAETGKVKTEALLSDVFPSFDALNYCIKNLSKCLSAKKVKSSVFFMPDKCRVEYRPSGTALIISPWNFPFFLAFVPVLDAVAAGNSTILKPSEITPETGKYILKLFEKAGFPVNTVQCVLGGAEAVQNAIKQKPARVLFTGSTKTGREIAKLCGELLIPSILELGGKAPAIICADADIERAANAVTYGAFMNNEQVCIAITRVIIDSKIKEKFIGALVKKTKAIRFGKDYGKLIQPERKEYLQSLIDEAVNKGAKIVYEGENSKEFLAPVIISGVTSEMRLFQKECFAPVLAITEYKSGQEAIELANNSSYGLAASIWSGNSKNAEKISKHINAGMIGINDSVKGIANAALPFGGIKDSGVGRYHSTDGLRFFSDKISVLSSKSKRKDELNWFAYNPEKYDDMKTVVMFMSGVKKFGLTVLKSAFKLFKKQP